MTHYPRASASAHLRPAGIVKGTPSWVHFGDGKDEIHVQLTPGHTVWPPAGYDLQHGSGACQMITVTVK